MYMTVILPTMFRVLPPSPSFSSAECAQTCQSDGRLAENVEKQLPYALSHFSLNNSRSFINISWLTDTEALAFSLPLCQSNINVY